MQTHPANAPRPSWRVNGDAARELLADPATTATTLLILVCRALEQDIPPGVTPLELLLGNPEKQIDPMDPVEMWMDVERFYNARITEAGENRVNALLLALSGDVFETEPDAFAAVCLALADGDLGSMVDGVFEMPQVDEMWWALREVTLARGTIEDFSEPVMRLMTKIVTAEDEGPDRAEVDDNIVAARFERLEKELVDIGAPADLAATVRQHAGA